jgi:cysteinyl-tRNA synthetase
MLTVGGTKMAKSEGNFITVRDALKQAPGEVVRLALLLTHYRDPLDWTEDRLLEARTILDHWYRALLRDSQRQGLDCLAAVHDEVLNSLLDDLNVRRAVSFMNTLMLTINLSRDPSSLGPLQDQLIACGRLLGLLSLDPSTWFKGDDSALEVSVRERIAARVEARRERRFADADRIRAELFSKGIAVEDGPQGTTWRNETTYWVQLWPNGKWDGKPYQRVNAVTPKEVAEKLHGGPLNETGGHHQIRAQVRIAGESRSIAYYEG